MKNGSNYATVVILPHDENNKPIWKDSRPISIPKKSNLFSIIHELDEMTKNCLVVLGEKLYRRSHLKSILDLSRGEITYAIYVVEIPENEPTTGEEALDVDASGRPKFRMIMGGKK